VKARAVLALGDGRLPLDTLFLDGGGVLVNPNWDRVSAALADQGVTVTAAALAAAEPFAKRELDSPAVIPATSDAGRGWLYFDLVLKHAGIPPSPGTDAALRVLRDYHARNNLWESVPSDVPAALGRFKAAGLRLVVVSNANGTVQALFDRLGLSAYFDHLFDSHVEKVEKPDPRFFARALTRSESRADRTVHVGDLYHVDVAGARAAGLGAVLLDSAGLYAGADCPRVGTLGELAGALRASPD
jgi:HAD superfamily hydrolase (TIGR01549 family)